MNRFKCVRYEEALKQLKHFQGRLKKSYYRKTAALKVEYTYDASPIPMESLEQRNFSELKVGEKWGELWGSAWMKFHGKIPEDWAGSEVVALIDIGAEGCIFVDGIPVQGLTHKGDALLFHRKRRFPLKEKAKGGEEIELLVEAAANEIFGAWGGKDFLLRQAELAVFDRDIWALALDVDYLLNLLENIPRDSVQSKKILYGLEGVLSLWQNGKGLAECRSITKKLLEGGANASSLEAVSQGHAHLDLAWLWPIRETRRKAGRTFSTALKLLDEYPEYKFGASQPQLYQWVKEDYPELYEKIRKAIKKKRWECQGAMWVEPDMNLISGESMVRQCLYGLKFYQKEFGVNVRNLWLPDVFGFSAALPQVLKKCGVDHFLSIKISWNDTNDFPLHTFWWEGIDGSRVLTHFPPAKQYHTANSPKDLIFSEKNFKQTGLCDSFMNLFGIGDGGGGPSREHIEFGKRSMNCEGVPRLRFDHAYKFFEEQEKIEAETLPVWDDELYLEFHRGTYTTQARLKRLNRRIENLLREAEILDTLGGNAAFTAELEEAWKLLLLHHFHDILPGSSIRLVNEEAAQTLGELEERVSQIREKALLALLNTRTEKNSTSFGVFNSLSWERESLIELPCLFEGQCRVVNSAGEEVPAERHEDKIFAKIQLPSLGYESIRIEEREDSGQALPERKALSDGQESLETERLCIAFGEDGSILSLYDKKLEKEWLGGYANRLLLWDDHPGRWDAWDISAYYRDGVPEAARLKERKIFKGPLSTLIIQELEIGQSRISQNIFLENDSPLIQIRNEIDWQEEHKMLKLHADTAVKSDFATFEIQYGAVRRSTKENNSWQQAQFEVPGHRFADLSEDTAGFALLNTASYGYRVKGSEMEQTLLRSPRDPDETADTGHHSITCAYFPHEGNFTASRVFKTAHELNAPAMVIPVQEWPGNIPVKESFYTLEGENVKIEVVKPAFEGGKTVVRLYEACGVKTKARFHSKRPWKSIRETDMMEREIKVLAEEGDTLLLEFQPFEIKTLEIVY